MSISQNTAVAGHPVDLGKLAAVILELAGLLALIYYFQLESRAFFNIAALAFGGFVVHYWLPLPLRLPFFLALSLLAVILVFGWQALWFIAIGLSLVGICHLPVSFRARVGLLVAAGVALAAMRAGWIVSPWSAAIWPILASMFMFRLIVYAHDLKHDTTAASVWQRLSYFFMLPNVCFPLFPVVDYKTFRRTYYNEERHRIYQTGVRWILRGLVQLVMYRLVYYYMSMSPAQVADIGDLGRYVVSGFLLYLRISGQFHVIVGLLKLFGFNLPETHHLYYLSTSFNDFWRRINIYWKDFMMKLFFYPAFFRLRKRGETMALVVATGFVFFMTWVLHAYQWFWIRGSYLFTATDILFWTVLAGLVMVNTVYESKHGGERLAGARAWTPRRMVGIVLQTGATFAVICVLWSLWSSASLTEWTGVWSVGLANPTVSDARLVPAAIAAVLGFCAVTVFFAMRERLRVKQSPENFSQSVSLVLATVAILSVAGTPELYAKYLPGRLGRPAFDVMASTREVRLSGHDADMLERGYYEDLLSVQSFNTQLWEKFASWPLNWSRLEDTGVLHVTGDFLKQELVPSREIHFRNATLTTNRWAMRDKDYERERNGAYRFALVGSSHVMGYGVDDDETFDAVVEARLNADVAGPAHEVLNFAVDGYNALQELRQLETKVIGFKPDAVLYFAHYGAPYRATLHLSEMAAAKIPIPYPELEDILTRAGVTPGLSRFDGEQRLQPFQNEILSWAYRRMVNLCRSRGIVPVWVYLPQITETVSPAARARFTAVAADAGFVTFSLAEAFDGHAPETIWFGEWDHHPNAFGHKLIGELLHRRIIEHRGALQSRVTALAPVQ